MCLILKLYGFIAQKENLCQRLEALTPSTAIELRSVEKEWADIREHFTAIRDLPKATHQKLESRFRQAENHLQIRMHTEKRSQRLAELDVLAEQSNTRKMPTPGNEAIQLENQTQGEKICLELEIFLELPTPKAFQAERMQYQMSRMQEAMLSRQQSEALPRSASNRH